MCDLEMIAAMLMFSVIGATAGGFGYLAFRKKKIIRSGANYNQDYLEKKKISDCNYSHLNVYEFHGFELLI